MQTRRVKQVNLTDECWAVQIWGLDYCNTCPLKNTDECGGQNIRRTGKNKKGIKVPIG